MGFGRIGVGIMGCRNYDLTPPSSGPVKFDIVTETLLILIGMVMGS
jgi:hypothetical protein